LVIMALLDKLFGNEIVPRTSSRPLEALPEWLRAHKDKFGTWPKPYGYKPEPIEPSPEVMACVRSRIIAFVK
jgi:hypothetical protein